MSSPTQTPPPFGTIIDVQLLFGPLLIGVFFNLILFGLLIAQMMTYFQSPKRDALWIRILVYYVLFAECSNSALDIAYMYQPLVLEYGSIPGNLPSLFITRRNSSLSQAPADPFVASDAEPLCVTLVGFPIQLFFIWRIRALTGLMILPIIFALLSAVSFGGGIWTIVRVSGAHRWDHIPRAYNAATVWLASSVGTDLCIAVCVAWALRKKKTGFASTDSVVDRIVRMTVQTGVITAIVNILDILCFILLKGKTVNFLWNIPLSKLYSNCMMSTLNARAGFKDILAAPASGGLSALRYPSNLSSRFTSDNKDTIVSNETYQTQDFGDDLRDVEYGIRMDKVGLKEK
ncbi:hypothetical protein B0H16DRAFT_1720808 [Mycena metata]|uniref:DUF6534 domain-containing protein n=1 Tax=Mycena metata TaxID=1033252 RepID=A0AAD7NEJ1_9AGAR|nr:hypothetical protein B0H16DRAFT_1720808 [Mycena metata]